MASTSHAEQVIELPEANTDITQDRLGPNSNHVALGSENPSPPNHDTLDLVLYLLKDCISFYILAESIILNIGIAFLRPRESFRNTFPAIKGGSSQARFECFIQIYLARLTSSIKECFLDNLSYQRVFQEYSQLQKGLAAPRQSEPYIFSWWYYPMPKPSDFSYSSSWEYKSPPKDALPDPSFIRPPNFSWLLKSSPEPASSCKRHKLNNLVKHAAAPLASWFGTISEDELLHRLLSKDCEDTAWVSHHQFIREESFWKSCYDTYRQARGPEQFPASSSSMALYQELFPYREFRVLLLMPGEDEEIIICELKPYLITHPPDFQALSYEWGDANSPSRSIQVNGHSVRVKSNLFSALRYLRQRKPVRLWVDALCINQSDTTERSMQVALMSQIYTSAKRVIAWTGLDEQHTIEKSILFLLRVALPSSVKTELESRPIQQGLPRTWQKHILAGQEETLLKSLRKYCRGEKPIYGHYEGFASPPSPARQKMEPIKLSGTLSQRSDWLNVATFFSIGYWKRLWIVQEIVLGSELRVQCGDYFIDWPVLKGLLLALDWLVKSEPSCPSYIINVLRLPASRILLFKLDSEDYSGMHQPRLGLPTALQRFTEYTCTYPCDKIYGLLGLVQGGHGIQPDYHMSLSQLLETLISSPSLRTDDTLVSFSQFMYRTLGRRVPADTELDNPGRTFYTRATICGTIEVIGDTFTSIEEARTLLVQWHELYFHKIKFYELEHELPSSVKQALSHISQDVGRVLAVDSALSYAYRGAQSNHHPSSKDFISHYNGSTQIGDDGSKCTSNRSKSLGHQPRWVIGSRGQIGLLPGTVRENDTLVHFTESDVCVVLRPFDPDGLFYRVIGGGLVIRQWDEEPERLHKGAPAMLRYSAGTKRRDFRNFSEEVDQMSLHLDAECLRLLTMQS